LLQGSLKETENFKTARNKEKEILKQNFELFPKSKDTQVFGLVIGCPLF
jgi:hypothetical protein